MNHCKEHMGKSKIISGVPVVANDGTIEIKDQPKYELYVRKCGRPVPEQMVTFREGLIMPQF